MRSIKYKFIYCVLKNSQKDLKTNSNIFIDGYVIIIDP